MNKTALKTVCDFSMLSMGDCVLAAVSGGADSMALLSFLLDIKDDYKLSLAVCHVNHLLRGDDAMRDEKFVESFCKEHSIDFYLKRCDVSALSRERGLGFEECAREVRYAFFSETAALLGGNVKIATAHNLNDCAETLIFNIARGTSPKGISSIAPVRDNIIRPLIYCTRVQIEDYLKEKNQPFCTDYTNLSDDYSRNFIRHKIIPLLNKINPAFNSAVKNLTTLSREQQEFFDELTQAEYNKLYKDGGIDKKLLLGENIALRRSIITKFLRENNVTVSKKRSDEILSLLEEEQFCYSVCKNGFLVLKDDGILRFKEQEQSCFEPFEFPFSLGEHRLSDDYILKISEISLSDFEDIKKNHKELLKNCIRYDIIDNSFVIRSRKIGDEITIFPRNVTKTLKKLLNESKIDAQKRDIIPIIAQGDKVHFVCSVAVDSLLAVKGKCDKIAYFEVLKNKSGERK